MEPLYVPIRYKLAVALNNWNPSDSSAYLMLKPWAQVLYMYVQCTYVFSWYIFIVDAS